MISDGSSAQLYEELREIIDGGSESMTHADAVEALRAMNDLTSEYFEAMMVAREIAANQVWYDLHIFGVPG